MRYTRLLFKVLAVAGLVGLSAVGAFAGLNPLNPGLPTVTIAAYNTAALPNNAMSALCVACHSRQVLGTGIATHFVFDRTHATNSGGGWNNADTSKFGATGVRDGAQYFHITAWNTPGIYSKYGDPTNARSVSPAPANTVGYELAASVTGVTNLQGMEIICESCHNIVKNVAGGNNLVEVPGDIASPRATDNTQYCDSRVATLCVGCHGWLYDSSPVMTGGAGGNTGYHDNVWNMIGETGTNVKNSNAAEYKNGAPRAINHHVMSGDWRGGVVVSGPTAGKEIAAAYLNWTPTDQFDPAAAHVMDTTVPTTGPRATGYLLKANWTVPFYRSTASTGNFSCLSCHMPGHGGAASTGASILRGSASGPAGVSSIDRISDPGRGWKDQDSTIASGAGTWCQNCHKN